MVERLTEGEIFDFDPPAVKSGRGSRRDFFSRTSEGFVMSLSIVGTTALAFWTANEGNYFQFLRAHIEVPQMVVPLCLVAGLINALRGNYADRLSNS